MEEAKQALENQDNHYINHLRDVSKTHDIATHDDVHAENGHKLIGKNVVINDDLYDKLMQHKLLKPLDTSISVADRLDAQKLHDDIAEYLKTDTVAHAIYEAIPDRDAMQKTLDAIPLNEALAGKMTVLKISMPSHYYHSLLATILAVVTAQACEYSEDEAVQLATAALFHDIGVLHIDPELLNKYERLDVGDLKQISAHTAIAYMVLGCFQEYSGAISTAVLQHHERLDGSGYPNRLRGDEISKMGKALAAIEVIASIIDKRKSMADAMTAIKTYPQKYDYQTVSAIASTLYGQIPEEFQDSKEYIDTVKAKLVIIQEGMTSWSQPFLMVDEEAALKSPASLITLRLEELKHALTSAGLLEVSVRELLDSLEGDITAQQEAAAVVNEFLYQLIMLVREILSRWPLLDKDFKIEKDTPIINWMYTLYSMIKKLDSSMKNVF